MGTYLLLVRVLRGPAVRCTLATPPESLLASKTTLANTLTDGKGGLTEPEEPERGDEDDLLLRLREELPIPAVVHHDAGQPPDPHALKVSTLALHGL